MYHVQYARGEIFVNLTSGTPEPLTAAVVMGYKRIFTVAGAEDLKMLQLPRDEDMRRRTDTSVGRSQS